MGDLRSPTDTGPQGCRGAALCPGPAAKISGAMQESRRPSTYKRVWFITGASDGIGRALTEAVLARGERAVVTARRPERVRELIERYPAQAPVVELDATRHEKVQRAVSETSDRFGRIDVL